MQLSSLTPAKVDLMNDHNLYFFEAMIMFFVDIIEDKFLIQGMELKTWR
jgi:hypothetical protein